MARRAKQTDNETATRPGVNGLDSKITTGFLDRVLNLHSQLDSERGIYMNACRGIRSDMAAVFDEANDKGIPKRGLKAAVKKRLLERKIDNIRDDMETADQDDYDMVLQALGDFGTTALGAATLKQHEKPDLHTVD